jgi:hypothetical protein
MTSARTGIREGLYRVAWLARFDDHPVQTFDVAGCFRDVTFRFDHHPVQTFHVAGCFGDVTLRFEQHPVQTLNVVGCFGDVTLRFDHLDRFISDVLCLTVKQHSRSFGIESTSLKLESTSLNVGSTSSKQRSTSSKQKSRSAKRSSRSDVCAFGFEIPFSLKNCNKRGAKAESLTAGKPCRSSGAAI